MKLTAFRRKMLLILLNGPQTWLYSTPQQRRAFNALVKLGLAEYRHAPLGVWTITNAGKIEAGMKGE